jgi:hypothetical protein
MSNKTEPSTHYVAITPHDSTNYDKARGVFVGVGGIVVAIRPDGTAVTFTGAVAGSILPIETIRINSTTTTATDMVALY